MAACDEAVEDLRCKKREFLQREIIEAGFQPDQFIQYCDNLRGSDIDLWTYDDLQACVLAFKTEHQPADFGFEPDDKEETKQPETHTKPHNISQEIDGEYNLPTRTITQTELFLAGKVEVTIPKQDVIPGGFLSSPYVLFSVKSSPIGWMVMRRYTDFLGLRKVLVSQYPGVYTPPIPDKARTDPDSITRLLPILLRFLDTLTRTPIFLSTGILTSFLRDDRSLFEGLLKKELKRRKVNCIEEVLSLSGSVACLSTFFPSKAMSDYCALSEALKRKISEQFSSLNTCLQSLSAQLALISESFHLLTELQDLLPEASAQKCIYKGLEGVLALWGKQESDIAGLTRSYGEFFLKGDWMEMTELGENVRWRDMLGYSALRNREKLIERKEKLWAMGDMAKWEISAEAVTDTSAMLSDKSLAITLMLPNETKEVEQQLHFFAYHNYQLKTEFTRILSNSARLTSLHFSEFCRLLDENRQVFCLGLRDFQGRLSAFY